MFDSNRTKNTKGIGNRSKTLQRKKRRRMKEQRISEKRIIMSKRISVRREGQFRM